MKVNIRLFATSLVLVGICLFAPASVQAQETRSQEEINTSIRISIENMVALLGENHAMLEKSAGTMTEYASSLTPNSSTSEALTYATQELRYMPQRLDVASQITGSLPIDQLFIATDAALAWQFIRGQLLTAQEHLTAIHADLSELLRILSAPEQFTITPQTDNAQ